MSLHPMEENSSLPAQRPEADRRKSIRFNLQVPAVVSIRVGDRHAVPVTTLDVSTTGISFHSDVALPHATQVEYVVTFPPELTRAQIPLKVRFNGRIARVEQQPAGGSNYLVALESTTYKYLRNEVTLDDRNGSPRA